MVGGRLVGKPRRDLCGHTGVDYRFGSHVATSRPWRADVAQLVAHHLAKVRGAGSNPVIRSKVQVALIPGVEGPSGRATACKAVPTGSTPVSTSSFLTPGAISSAGERFPDTEEVTGSIPVSRTRVIAAKGTNWMPAMWLVGQIWATAISDLAIKQS